MNETAEERKLTNNDYNSLKTKIVNYRNNFDEMEFSTVYDFRRRPPSRIGSWQGTDFSHTSPRQNCPE